MITSNALTSTDALQDLFTTMQTSGGSMSLETILLYGVAAVLVLFLVWYFFLRQTE